MSSSTNHVRNSNDESNDDDKNRHTAGTSSDETMMAPPRLIDEIEEDFDTTTSTAVNVAAGNDSFVSTKNFATTKFVGNFSTTTAATTAATATISTTTQIHTKPTDDTDDSKIRALEEWLRQQEQEEEELQETAMHGGRNPAANVWNDTTTEVNVVPPPLPPPEEEGKVEEEEEIEEEEEEEEIDEPQERQDDQLILDHLPPDLIDDILLQQQQHERLRNNTLHTPHTKRPYLLTYRPLSLFALVVLIWYAVRTRKQYYFTVVYLSHSKYAYVILGNTIIATAIILFDIAIYLFFRTTTTTTNRSPNATTATTATTTTGLRMQEAEGLQDFFRWNVTETCLALTMFRYELTILTAIQFVFLILLKCLHYVAAQREQHLRMTEDVIITTVNHTGNIIHDDEEGDTNDDDAHPTRTTKNTIASYMNSMMLFLRSNHTSIIVFFVILQGIDMYIIQHCIVQILKAGQPSVKILFAFEAAILLVSTYCHVILYLLHVIDCSIQYGHDILEHRVAKQLLHPWKEYKATFIFAIELQAQAINFLFYCTFFCIVLTFYGLPINLFREVYMSFIKLKERLTSFFHYRQLMASMNRFRTATDEELNQSGRTCIICRDEMTSGHDCKRLPVCTHTFHKSCLREWLVQQQSCPTCRADIAAMEALEASRTAAANAATQRTTTDESTNVTTTEDVKTDTTTSATDPTALSPVATDEKREPPSTSTKSVSTLLVDREHNVSNRTNEKDMVSSSIPVPTTKSSSSTVTFSSTSTIIHTKNQNVGVIQPIHPTLYKVVGKTHISNIYSNIIDEAANENVPVYSHDSIVTLDDKNSSLVPIRTIPKNTLVLGMAQYQKQHLLHAPTMSQTMMTYIQLPDQSWIPSDYLQSIHILNRKID